MKIHLDIELAQHEVPLAQELLNTLRWASSDTLLAAAISVPASMVALLYPQGADRACQGRALAREHQ
jgi:hypothetical protein